MKKCAAVQNELHAYLFDDVDELTKAEVGIHLDECSDCSCALEKLRNLSRVLHTWEDIEPSPDVYEQLLSRMKTQRFDWKSLVLFIFSRRTTLRLVQVTAIVILTLVINSWLHKPLPVKQEDRASINFLLQEHQGAIVQSISTELLSQPATHLYIGRDDIMYFEYVEDHPKETQPGIILRGPRFKQQIALTQAPAITKGHPIEKSQVHLSVNFEPAIPERLPNDFVLSCIRAIEGYNCLHLLYTRKLDSLSLFQQSSQAQEKLSAQDYRDFAFFCSQEASGNRKIKGKGTILAWSEGMIFFVLIGDADITELLNMVPSIKRAGK